MINQENMVIWVNQRFYWEMAIKPEGNEVDGYFNYFTLIDSVEKKALETISYRADIILPMLRDKDMDVFRKIGIQLRDVAAKHGIFPIEAKDLPRGKRQR